MSKSKRYCSVPNCSTYASEDVAIHFFPLKDKKLSDAWKHVLKIGKPLSKYMTVCSKHFLPTDYMPVTPDTQRKRLKRGVIPSQNLPVGSHERKRAAERASDRSARRVRRAQKKNTPPHRDMAEQQIEQLDNDLDDHPMQEVNPQHVIHLPEPQMEIDATVVTFVDRGTQTEEFEYILPNVLTNDEKLKSFTNVDHKTLETLEQCCNNVLKERDENVENLRLKIMLLLMKVKLNIPFLCLAILFNISQPQCSRYFYNTLSLLAAAIRPLIYWPSKNEILANMPQCFKPFLRTRVVLDCTEVSVDKCKCLSCRIRTYSHYKGTHTIKFLIGITPSGLLSFVSSAYGGRSSDKAIFNNENLIEKLDIGDAIMVDKGFLIEKECEEHLIHLIRPPFLRKQHRFSKADANTTAEIAKARVHVERTIQRIKMYKILSEQVAWYLVPCIDDIMTVVAALVNLSPPILADDKFLYHLDQ